MKTSYALTTAAAAVIVAAGAFYFIDIDQTQEGKLPNVDISVEGGQAPEYDVTTGSVDIGTTEKKVTVPTVSLEEKNVTVPTLEIQPAKE